MNLDCHQYFPLSIKLFIKKLKRYSGIFKCSRKGYRKSRYLKWKERVMERSASTINGRKVKRRSI